MDTNLLDVAVWAINSTTGNMEVHLFLATGTGSSLTAPPIRSDSKHLRSWPDSSVAVRRKRPPGTRRHARLVAMTP